MEFQGRRKASIHLNIAPLIDIVFLLLLFFMLSSHFLHQTGIKVRLPQASTAGAYSEENIEVTIAADSSVYLNGEHVAALDNLPEALQEKIEAAGSTTILMKADETVDVGFVVRVIDMIRQADRDSVILSTERECR